MLRRGDGLLPGPRAWRLRHVPAGLAGRDPAAGTVGRGAGAARGGLPGREISRRLFISARRPGWAPRSPAKGHRRAGLSSRPANSGTSAGQAGISPDYAADLAALRSAGVLPGRGPVGGGRGRRSPGGPRPGRRSHLPDPGRVLEQENRHANEMGREVRRHRRGGHRHRPLAGSRPGTVRIAPRPP